MGRVDHRKHGGITPETAAGQESWTALAHDVEVVVDLQKATARRTL